MKKLFKGILVILVLVTCSIILTGCTESPEKVAQYENVVEEADLLYDGHSYTEALGRYEEATKLIPSKIEAYRGIVNIFIDKGRLEDAASIVNDSTQKLSQADKSILYSIVGNAYFEVDSYEKALEMYDSATALGVSNVVAELGKAKVYLKQNKSTDAEKILSKNIFEEDTLYEAKLLYSYVKSLTDTEDATEILDEVTPSEEWSTKYSEFSNILESIDEDELYNATKLAQVFINEGYPYLATTLLSPLEERMVEYPDGLYFLGRALLDIGSYDSALTKLEGAVSAGALNSDVFRTMARVYIQKGDMESATEYYDRAVSYGGENVSESLITEYIELLIENNLFTKAQEVLKIGQQYYEEVWIDILAIRINYLLEDTEKVQYYIDQALEKEVITTSEKKTIYYWDAQLAFDASNLDSVEEKLTSLRELDRFNPYYYLLTGEVLYQKGDFDNSQENFELAIEYDLGEGVAEDAEKALARFN
jgi:tetratricopeptide (TPR) repeat protein